MKGAISGQESNVVICDILFYAMSLCPKFTVHEMLQLSTMLIPMYHLAARHSDCIPISLSFSAVRVVSPLHHRLRQFSSYGHGDEVTRKHDNSAEYCDFGGLTRGEEGGGSKQ